MKSLRFLIAIAVIFAIAVIGVSAQGQRGGGRGQGQPGQPGQEGQAAQAPQDPMSTPTFSGLRFRSIGPGVTGGRVVGFAVDPNDRAKYFAAVASGGVWKTVNGGTTWTPVFDNYGSFSIGYIALDPKDSAVLWVGTGENNSQRSVAYGDGLYKSEDGGRTFRKVGLEKSEHIGKIVIDPRDSKTVYVAAQGPLWGPGGDRGLFKTTDGGKTWKNILNISEHTGVTDIAVDPSNPDIVYAASWQRRRHFYTLINGGPESALYKSTDGGATWNKLRGGLPSGEVGRIGIAVSPVSPNVVYATVEAEGQGSGIFRSQDRGATWERMNPAIAQAMYYSQIICDPKDVDRIYIPNVIFQVSDDGGRTIRPLGERSKHVDNHAIWIDPNNTNYYIVGSDGGIYDSYDRGATWQFKSNMPITQFYDIALDNSTPFYNVCGGTQDNNSWCGPSRTRSATGITNADWFVTQGGDGFHTRVDPEDPNTIYATLQYGSIVRFDKRTGERIGIQPKEGKGDAGYRWNWDSPLIISPHSHTRIYFAANKLFRSDDRGDTWKVISSDLTRQLDRDKLPVMGKVWGPDAIAKHQSTAAYGNISAISESPKKEGLIYIGTDDGLIQSTEDGGKNWRKTEKIEGVPENSYVARIFASQHDAGTVYALYNNHQNSDFAPYIVKSKDAGRTWALISSNLPKAHPLWAIAEDHVNPNLLFVGTEFGLFFSTDGGAKWIQMRSGLPVIAVRDLAIQKRENDLVVGTFGRGAYILDDYSPLRTVNAQMLAQEAATFPVKDALMYIQSQPYGGRGKAFQGESLYTADSPYGAAFTYYLKDSLKTKKQQRKDAERKGNAPFPTREDLIAEEEEEAPMILLTVTDASGNIIRRLNGANAPGIQRLNWDLRYPSNQLAPPRPPGTENLEEVFGPAPSGGLVMPGKYSVTLSQRYNGVWKQLGTPQSFNVTTEGLNTMAAADRKTLFEFQQKVGRLQRAVNGALSAANELRTNLATAKRALMETPAASEKLVDEVVGIDRRLNEILKALRGDSVLRARQETLPPSISERVNGIVGDQRMSTSRPTQTHITAYGIAAADFDVELKKLRTLIEVDAAKLEKSLEAIGAPWTSGRLPVWQDR
ncbi:MAG: glycosyl hydrolase [Acidobacteria bacterium]|nr:glycosyl hydrolase [Acidobacteriota bacterium]